jgi:hypothetical protein
LIVKKFDVNVKLIVGIPFKERGIGNTLGYYIKNCGFRNTDRFNQFKRKEIPRLHGFRKFFTKQLVDSKVNPEIREMLLGHQIGLASAYYKPTVQEMLNEYLKAVRLLTFNEENRLKLKLEQRVRVEKSQIEALKIQKLPSR